MKKIFIFLLIFCCSFMLFGCQKKDDIENNMSEITKVYFSGETNNGELFANICVGERENPYIINGKHEQICDFSLISLKFSQQMENIIEINLIINGINTPLSLELNPANHIYMSDLGYALSPDDEISLTFLNYSLTFENISKNFEIDYSEAVKLSKEALKDEIESYYQGNTFVGECYLKILSEQNTDKELFWIFTIIGQNNQSNNVVIDIKNGEILLKN